MFLLNLRPRERGNRLGLALFLLTAGFLCLSGLSSVNCAESVKVPDETLQKASPLPDRVILTPVGDPARMMGVNWRTDTTVTRGLAEIASARRVRPSLAKPSRSLR
jgi:hypothetical protein